MSLTFTCPEDVVNAALTRIGYQMRIANIYDGSKAANAALNVYSQTRDELLRQNDWAFAERNTVLTLLKSAPVGGYIPPTTWDPTLYPPLPWQYEYSYPTDCLKIRAVKGVPLFLPVVDPQPVLYGIENDTDLEVKVLLCNIPSAVLVYTGQVTDPTAWEADFVEAATAAIARRIVPALMGLEAVKLFAADETVSTMVAEKEQG